MSCRSRDRSRAKAAHPPAASFRPSRSGRWGGAGRPIFSWEAFRTVREAFQQVSPSMFNSSRSARWSYFSALSGYSQTVRTGSWLAPEDRILHEQQPAVRPSLTPDIGTSHHLQAVYQDRLGLHGLSRNQM